MSDREDCGLLLWSTCEEAGVVCWWPCSCVGLSRGKQQQRSPFRGRHGGEQACSSGGR